MRIQLWNFLNKSMVFFILIISLISTVYANSDCPDGKQICLEYGGTICKPVISKEYQDCLAENEKLQRDCGKEGVMHCSQRVCPEQKTCEPGCVKWGCEGDNVVSSGTPIEEHMSSGEQVAERVSSGTPMVEQAIEDTNIVTIQVPEKQESKSFLASFLDWLKSIFGLEQ